MGTRAEQSSLPLSADAVELFKESIDLTTLAALQHADREARRLNRERIDAALMKKGWKDIAGATETSATTVAATPKTAPVAAAATTAEKFATIKAIVAEKLAAFEAYNNLAMPVFLRNLQVYMARHMWPEDPAEGKAFKDQFTEVMVAWTTDVLLEAEKQARKAGHPLIRVEDVHAALEVFQPHEANQYEDIIYFPRLPKNERVVIEAYDLDSFRDPGIHWVYLSEALNDPKYKGTIEPDPFAAELLVEGAAQFGVLVLRVAGTIAGEEEKDRLERAHLTKCAGAHPEAARQTRRRAAGEENQDRHRLRETGHGPGRRRHLLHRRHRRQRHRLRASPLRLAGALHPRLHGGRGEHGAPLRSADVRRLGRGRGRHRQ